MLRTPNHNPRHSLPPDKAIPHRRDRSADNYLSDIGRLILSSVTSKSILALSALLIVRYMSADEFIKAALSLSVISALNVLITGGVGRLYVLDQTCNRPEASDSTYFSVQLAITAIASVVLSPVAITLGPTYLFVVFMIVGQGVFDYTLTVLQRRQLFTQYAVAEISQAMAFVFGLVAVERLTGTISTDLFLFLQTASFVVVFFVFGARGIDFSRPVGLSATYVFVRRLLSHGRWRVLLYFLVIALLSQSEIWLLTAIASPDEVASYGVATRYYGVLLLGLGAVHTVMLPRTQAIVDYSDYTALYGRQWACVALFVPVVFTCVVTSPLLMPLIDGGKYPESFAPFCLLAISATISFAFSPYANLLFRFGDYRFLLRLSAFALVLHISAAAGLIWSWGAIGAAIGNILCYTMFTFTIFLRARQLAASQLARPQRLEVVGSPLSG